MIVYTAYVVQSTADVPGGFISIAKATAMALSIPGWYSTLCAAYRSGKLGVGYRIEGVFAKDEQLFVAETQVMNMIEELVIKRHQEREDEENLSVECRYTPEAPRPSLHRMALEIRELREDLAEMREEMRAKRTCDHCGCSLASS